MALDLNDPKAIDYSNSQDLFPFDVYGTFKLQLLSYVESGEAGSEKNKGDKEFDLATCRVEESTNEAIPVGSTYGFFFQTGGNGMSVKARPYKAAELRAFHAAVVDRCGDKAFDSNAARKEMLVADLSAGEEHIILRAVQGNAAVDKDKQPVYKKNKDTGEYVLDAAGNKVRFYHRDLFWSAVA